MASKSIFADKNIGFNNVYQSEINERPVKGTWEKAGGHHKNKVNGNSYVHELVKIKKRSKELFGAKDKIKRCWNKEFGSKFGD
ncbi:MAG: hypothetical protein HKN87_18390 [Saprospiraceae bacterium]|nr:hypothetical protein [Saprospiraceae bacterium]